MGCNGLFTDHSLQIYLKNWRDFFGGPNGDASYPPLDLYVS